MNGERKIFRQIYENYLDRIRGIDLGHLANVIGAEYEKYHVKTRLLNAEYKISAEGIKDPSGQKPANQIYVILGRYILSTPKKLPVINGWASYSNFKNSTPLTDYFKRGVAEAISSHFSDKFNELKKSCRLIGGHQPSIKASYDLAFQFDALPLIPLLLLYNNNSDSEFPAKCFIMFGSHTDEFLDCECIAMLGRQLVNLLKP